MAANGANGRPSAPRSRQPPASTRAPASPAPAANSLTSRDLPIPASPPMSTADGEPAPGAVQGGVQGSQMLRAADEDRAAHARAHVFQDAIGR